MLDLATSTERAGAGWLDATARPELAARFGRYELLRVIGAGGTAVVLEARDPALDRIVAIKVLRARAGVHEAERRLQHEARITARVVHPHVIRIYDVGVAHGHGFVAMELAHGTFAAWLAAAPRSRSAILAAFVAAGRGLAAIHAAGIVHRDVKPSNLLLDASERPLVADFGLAIDVSAGAAAGPGAGAATRVPADDAELTTRSTSSAAAGTPRYMAPEQLAGAPVDARADQFSFCVALWRTLVGTPPFAGDTAAALAAAMAACRPSRPSTATLSPALLAALERGLCADPAARFPSMDALLDAIAPATRRQAMIAPVSTW